MQKKTLVTLVAAGLSLLASTAFAENSEKCGCWYVGAGVGQSRVNIDNVNVPGVAQSNDEHDTGWKVFAGYQWNPNFAIEGGWVDLGKFNTTLSSVAGTASVDYKVHGVFLDAVGVLPLNESFSLFGKVGTIYTDASTDVGGSLAPALSAAGFRSDSKDEFNLTAGLGAQYDFTREFGVRAEWERYFNVDFGNSDSGDVDLFSVSAVYSFY